MGEEILIRRIKKGMRQTEVAKKAGLTTSAINNIERGYRIGRLDTIQLILDALGCELVVREREKIGK